MDDLKTLRDDQIETYERSGKGPGVADADGGDDTDTDGDDTGDDAGDDSDGDDAG